MLLKETSQRRQERPERLAILNSPRINTFLKSVQEGDYLAFIDNDQTITKRGIDTEDIALAAGIIPPERRGQSGEFVPSQGIDTQAVGDPARNALRKILGMYTTHVTPELSTITGMPVGTIMSSDVLKKTGRYVGDKLIKKDLLREDSINILKALMKENIRSVIVTATPVEIVEGVYEALDKKYKFQSPITIIGTEVVFDSEGRATDKLHLFGPPKTEVIQACKEKGAIALFGIGDKPLSSDAFMWQCENPVPINDKEYGDNFGNTSWRRLAAIAKNSI